MYRQKNDPTLINEEQRAVKWFLALFYLIYAFYEVFYHTIYKNIDLTLPREINIWMYVSLLLLLPISFYLIKRGKLYLVKYFFVVGYLLISVVNESLIFSGDNLEYQSGNAVEILLVLFSPFFVNTRFFVVVTSGLVAKYVFFGVLLESVQAMLPITLVIVLSGIAYILLRRFQSYLDAIKKSYDYQLEGIVKGVIATIELKDPYTRGHSERVAYYANSLARETGKFTNEELNSINYACLLHDIGKVNIPDSILMKPGKLTKEEFEVIKTHPKVGADAIIEVSGLGDNIGIVKFHHERWDGKGYPDQLKGREIPYLARIVSIADAFDAMTSSRSYRAALPVEEAYKRILEGRGTQFDPELVDIFKKVFSEWIIFHEKYEWESNFPLKKISLREEVTL
jgi:HD-GYP domain-containing protein (c-di-GMP phosphodiesterase class II)